MRVSDPLTKLKFPQMLMNGHKECMLYKDQKSSHPSGDAFDPEDPDVDYFCGSDFELIVLMDRDNCLSENFFNIANGFFEAHPDVQILQPAITPYPAQFRRGLSGETYYTSLSAKFQALGNDLAKYKRVFIPSAAFYGKGIIRRSTYNETLLGYNPQTGSTDEEDNIPRDLLSHDIIESSVMRAMLAPEIAVYEDFAQTHVEWALRQQRWDLGDLIISK
jgi:membrane glycosyltransferase